MKKKQDFIMKPKVDFCFKELMAVEAVRRGFISALLGVDPGDIEHTTLLPTHLRKEHSDDKLGILDVHIQMSDGTQIDMEIQLAAFMLWPERSLFYLSRMYAGQLNSGDDYDGLQKCIHVGILNFELFKGEDAYYSSFHLLEDDRHFLYTDKLEIHILELPKLRKKAYPENELLDWARFINAEQRKELKDMAEKNEYIERAYETLVHLSADEEKRLEYEAREKAIRDHNYMMKTNLELGYQAGKEKGWMEGREEGIEEGIRILISDHIEEGVPQSKTINKLVKFFGLELETARNYYEQIAATAGEKETV